MAINNQQNTFASSTDLARAASMDRLRRMNVSRQMLQRTFSRAHSEQGRRGRPENVVDPSHCDVPNCSCGGASRRGHQQAANGDDDADEEEMSQEEKNINFVLSNSRDASESQDDVPEQQQRHSQPDESSEEGDTGGRQTPSFPLASLERQDARQAVRPARVYIVLYDAQRDGRSERDWRAFREEEHADAMQFLRAAAGRNLYTVNPAGTPPEVFARAAL